MVEQDGVTRMNYASNSRDILTEKYPWVLGLPYKTQQFAMQAAYYKEENDFQLMVVRPFAMVDGGLSKFMGLPVRTITLWEQQKEVVLFVSEEQRNLFLEAFPEANAV
jgi:hypothetical protein